MKIIDCTLRDGGFTFDFNWSKNFYFDYFKLTNFLNVEKDNFNLTLFNAL